MARWMQMVPYLLASEGGISRDTNDQAAANPAPGTNGVHTNKGVTWSTYVAYKQSRGQQPSVPEFMAMPANVWGDILKGRYWDAVRGDSIRNDAIAFHLTDFAWGSGPGTAIQRAQRVLNNRFGANVPITGSMNNATLDALNRINEKQLFDALYADRQSFLDYLTSSATYAMYKVGWNRRMRDFHARFSRLANSSGSSMWPWLIGTAIGLTAAGAFGIRVFQRRKRRRNPSN